MFRVEKIFTASQDCLSPTTAKDNGSEWPIFVATFAFEDEASWYCRLLNKQSDNLGLGLTYAYSEE